MLVSAPRGRRADALARGMVEARLAACVSVVPAAVSHYRWKGRLRRDAEALLVIKTRAARLAALKRWIARRHPYEVPELLALPAAGGSAAYLAWLLQETAKPRR